MNDDRRSGERRALVEDRLGTRARVYGSERAILVGLDDGAADDELLFDELEALADTAGIPALATVVQKRGKPDPATLIGRGKVDEVAAAASALGADVVIFNHDLTPAQARNLEERLRRKVIDRTQLIMDIFAQRAATKEAKLQVELAQLRYLLPRLRGWGMALTRIGGGTGGGVGTRGPGETQLEMDRDRISRRIHTLERRLAGTEAERNVRRRRRERSELPQVALVGYTNSGKSTLLNRLCDEDAFVEDKLFATQDTVVRRGKVDDGRTVLFVDTVGFIRRLPHHLVPAFAASLEAARHADLLLHVIDASKAGFEDDRRAVMDTLEHEVFHGALRRPAMLDVFNKIDLRDGDGRPSLDGIEISAKLGTHIERLLEAIGDAVYPSARRREIVLPFAALHLVNPLVAAGRARVVRYEATGAEVEATLSDCEWETLRRAGARAFIDEG